MTRTYDSWKTTDPRDMEPPEKPERDPDAEYDAWRDEQLQHAHYGTQTVEELKEANRTQAGAGTTPTVPLDEIVGKVAASTIRRLEADIERMQPILGVLGNVQEYLDNRADVDDGIPNEAMRLLVEVRAAIRKAEGR